MFKNIFRKIGGDPFRKDIERLAKIVDEINQLEQPYEALSSEDLKAKTGEFRQRLEQGETLDDLLVEAFATVREVSKRTIGLRHYDIQMIGGITLHQGKIAEMRTGEGKTLVATLPMYLNALAGKGVHLVTVNDYLARRDARWMAPIFSFLGLKIGVLQMSLRTGGGPMAFLVDLEKTSSQEDQHQLVMVPRREAYAADITYGTNSEFGFDYLRDNLTMRLEDRVQRGHHYAIIDEVDNILIDEARTPLIISGPSEDQSEWYIRMAQVVRQLVPEDYEVEEKDRTVTLTEIGEVHVEELLEMPLRDPERPEDITPEQARMLGYLEQALRAQHLYRRNKDYLVQGGKVVIVDEFTGRLMPGRRWSEGLHQAVEAKEGVKVEAENITYATITLQNYFRMYEKISGMTGTAATEAEEFYKIYTLDVLPIPTNLEYVASLPDTGLDKFEDKDEFGYRYTYYAASDDAERQPQFWKRKDYPDVVYRSAEAKLRAITQEVFQYYVKGRPQLVGTTSVEHSEILSGRLGAEPIRRLMQVLLIRDAWLEQKNADMVDRSDTQMQVLNAPLTDIKAGDLRPLARSLNLSLNPEDPDNIQRLKAYFGFTDGETDRLIQALQGGVVHEVLNARKHDQEAGIIAQAGAFGAVTIATNMAGRGVDIKLGGELSEEIIRDVNRVLNKAGRDPYDMTNEERQAALRELDPDQYGIYEESVQTFLEQVENMDRVRELGGLHVIGSERHEARRIDNQLRGRAARQGDPGSSRFYLSLEDDLMRLFGGAQVENLWKRIMFDEYQPLEINLLGKLVEQSQERVEGANFDIRKHLLEYDDVLNAQRERIYGQRDRVFLKQDLDEDILDMLELELKRRIPQSLEDEEGPWKLLAYLNDVQPIIDYGSVYYPSFTIKILFDAFRQTLPEDNISAENLEEAALELARNSIQADKDHLLLSTQRLLDRVEENLDIQLEERMDTLDTFVSALEAGNEDGVAGREQDLLTELMSYVRTPLKLSKNQLQQLVEGDQEIVDEIRNQVDKFLFTIQVNRLIGSIERRLDESLGLRAEQLLNLSWGELADQILDAVEGVYDRRVKSLLGKDGLIARDLKPILDQWDGSDLDDRQLIRLLSAMQHGTQLAFDAKTHRKSRRQYVRLRYVYLAAHALEEQSPEEVTDQVLAHLQGALLALQTARGEILWNQLRQREASLNVLSEKLRLELAEDLGQEKYEVLLDQPLAEISETDRARILEVLGRRMQNEAYRELLLRVISEQWVEYLTKVEALRVSIRMEAYAQRDPLVQYKSKATEMFQGLLVDIRTSVITRVFTYNPRSFADLLMSRTPAASVEQPEDTQKEVPQQVDSEKRHKKKRRRH